MSNMEDRDKNNIFYITHKGEFLLWLIVILLVVAISVVISISNKNSGNNYNIFMPDVDGLIEGSPVRIMGIDVGYVTKIKPTNDEIFVRFNITDKDIVLPIGTQATVEFSGMAGSKSLELYLPDKNSNIGNSEQILTVTPPKRLHDALGLLNEMFDKIAAITHTSSSFGKNLNFISMPSHKNENDFQNFLKYSDKIIYESNERAENLNRKLGKYGKQ